LKRCSTGGSCETTRAATRLPGTSFTEGIKASVRPRKGEKIEFYRADGDAFRAAFKLERERVCDLVVHLEAVARDVLLLLELKGSHPSRGFTQIEATYAAIQTCVHAEAERRRKASPRIEGLILSHGSSPLRDSKMLPIRRRTIPKTAKSFDFGEYLR